MADVTSIYGNPIKDAVARADISTLQTDVQDVKDGLEQLETDLTNAINDVYVTDTASGAIASFPDGADNVPVKSLTVDIEPVQSGSGDPSPTNVRPISGHSTATVTRTGKNLLIYPFGNTAPRTINGVTFTPNSDGSVTANGTASAQAVYTIHASMPIPDGTYILSGGKSTNKYVELGYFNSDTATTENRVSDNATRVATFTSHKGRITYLQLIISSGQTLTNEVFYPMIRLSSVSDATFAPYTAQTVTIDLNGTRYGGSLDVGTGVLTVDRVIKTLDGSENNWVYASGSGGYFYYNPTAALFPNIKTYDSTVISNRLKTVGDGTAFASNTFCIYNASQLNFKCDTSVNTVALFKSWLGNNPLTVVYPFATPTTVQLTAQDDITTVLGQNNVWNDCGDTTVEYRADTKLYIQKVLNG